MIFIFTFLSFLKPSSYSIWKDTYHMDDPNYLPIVPIFQFFQTQLIPDLFGFADVFSSPNSTDLGVIQILKNLNHRINTTSNLNLLRSLCDQQSNSHACLAYARIYEFGSYGTEESSATAIKYYEKAAELNCSIAYSMLSFYHRYFDINIPLSIMEADASGLTLESIIPIALQHYKGKYRPKSCYSSTRRLKPVGSIIATMNDYVFPMPLLSDSEYHRIQDSEDPKDLYTRGLIYLTDPFPSIEEVRNASVLLQKSYEQGYDKAGPAYAFTLLLLENTTKGENILIKHSRLSDPVALYLWGIQLISSGQILDIQNGKYLLQQSKDSGFLPAIHYDGFLYYYGLNGHPRNSKKAYQIFTQSASLGHIPSINIAATMLIGGDGPVVNCDLAMENLMKLLDFGPWTKYLERYVSRGSETAFLKMIDMGITPNKLLKTNKTTTKTYMEKSEEYLQNVRMARNGDSASLIYLALQSPFKDAIDYINKLKQKERSLSALVFPLKLTIFLKYLMPYLRGDLEDDSFFASFFNTLLHILLILLTFISLVCLVFARINYTLSSK